MYIIRLILNKEEYYMTGLIAASEYMNRAIRYSADEIEGAMKVNREHFKKTRTYPVYSPEYCVDELCKL